MSAPLVAEGNNLRRRLHRFSGPRNLLNHQAPIPNYEKGLIRLEQKCKVAHDKQKCLDAQIPQLCKDYGQLSCRALCDAMESTLPRELRDSIYEYIFDNNRVIVDHPRCGGCSFKCSKYSYRDAGQAMLISPLPKHTSHLLETGYTGNLSVEIVETWYRCSTYVFHACDSMLAFLRHDPCGMGLQPFRYVNRVELVLKRIDLDQLLYGMTGTMTHASNLAKGLKVLCVLKEGATVDIIIDAAKRDDHDIAFLWVVSWDYHDQAPLSQTFLESLDVVIAEMHQQQRHAKHRLRVSVKKRAGSEEMQQYLLGKDLGDIRLL